jgi:[ribosomal protein S5]-alanine N-acetyltransferase
MATLTSYQHLTTDELVLRPIELTDASAMFSYTSDPRVAQFTHWNPHRSPDQVVAYIKLIDELKNTHVWGIALKESNLLIGECSITQHDNGRAELYYALARNQWGNGYTTQALKTLLAMTDEVPEIVRLEAWIIPENVASCRVAQKAGLSLEQTLQQAWTIEQTPHDIALYIK